MSIKNELDKIKNAVYGKEIRGAIHDGIKKAYDDASEKGNANMEVKMARGTYQNLNERFKELDKKDTQLEEELSIKAEQDDLDKTDKSIKDFNDRVDKIIATPTTVSEQEIIDARQGNQSLGANLTGFKKDLETQKNNFLKNTLFIKNSLKNSLFEDETNHWTGSNANIKNDRKTLTITGTGTSSVSVAFQKLEVVDSKKEYYAYARIKVLNNECNEIGVRLIKSQPWAVLKSFTIKNPVKDKWYTIKGLFTAEDISPAHLSFEIHHIYSTPTIANGKQMEVEEPTMVSLTDNYKGREKPSISEFESLIFDKSTGRTDGHFVLSQEKVVEESNRTIKNVEEKTNEFINQINKTVYSPIDSVTSFSQGTIYDDIEFEKKSEKPNVHEINVIEAPEMVFMEEFAGIAGVDPEGYAVNQAGNKRTNDGGKTYETITSNSGVTPFIWFDSQGNAYRSSRKDIFRSDASNGYTTYDFKKVAEYDSGFASGFSFGEDGLGGVYFIEYGFGEVHSNLLYSHDWGNTFTKSNLDYGQLHFHAVHYHKPSGNLYVVVGEAGVGAVGSWKGILKSKNRGVTFSKVTTLENKIQPISAVTRGKYIIWGKDSTPSGFLVHNTEDDTIETIVTHNNISENGGSPNNTGFYYSLLKSERLLVANGAIGPSNPTSMYPLVYMDGLDEVGAITMPLGEDGLFGKRMFTSDKSDYIYLQNREESGTYSFKKIKRQKKKFWVSDRTEVLSIGESNAEIVGSFNGLNIHKYENGRYSFPALNVLGNEHLTFVSYIKRDHKDNVGNIRFKIMNETTNGKFYSSYYEGNNVVLADGKFQKIMFQYTVPTDVRKLYIEVENYGNNPTENNYYLGTPLSIQSIANTTPRFATETRETYHTMNASVADTFLFKDIILNDGYSEYYKVGKEMILLTVNNIEFGLVRKSAEYGDTWLYVKQDNTLVGEVKWGQFAGTIKGEKKIKYSQARFQQSHLRPAPTRLGVTNKKVVLYSAGDGMVHEFPLAIEVEGYIEVEMRGSCYHSPELYQDVSDSEVNNLLLT